MSAPFTITNLNWWQPSKLEELRRAYSERVVVMNGLTPHDVFAPWPSVCISNGVLDSAVFFHESLSGGFRKFSGPGWVAGNGTLSDALLDGVAVSIGPEYSYRSPLYQSARYGYTSVDFFSKLQAFISFDAVRAFCDPESVTVNGFVSSTFNSYADYFSFIGGNLYADDQNYGFRRSFEVDQNNLPVMTRGMCRPGDILGPWIIEDIVACFSKLTHTRADLTENGGYSMDIVDAHSRMVYEDGGVWHDNTFDFEAYHTFFDPYGDPGEKYYGYSTRVFSSVCSVPISSIKKYYTIITGWNPRAPGTNGDPESAVFQFMDSYAPDTEIQIGNGTDGGDIPNQTVVGPLFVLQWDFSNAGTPSA